jgi:cysteinyl-tRNA synthetase
LCDDLNTPLAVVHLHELATELNKAETDDERRRLKGALLGGGRLLGVLAEDPESWLKWRPPEGDQGFDEEEIEVLVMARSNARANRDFTEADRIRDKLKVKGIVLEDLPDGTTDWRRGG